MKTGVVRLIRNKTYKPHTDEVVEIYQMSIFFRSRICPTCLVSHDTLQQFHNRMYSLVGMPWPEDEKKSEMIKMMESLEKHSKEQGYDVSDSVDPERIPKEWDFAVVVPFDVQAVFNSGW